MNGSDEDTDRLQRRFELGDEEAIGQLLARHRQRLRQMVAVHLDQRLTGRVDPSDVVQRLTDRVDPSDVVQDSFITASRRLPEYAQQRPIPSLAWLRQIAWERLLDLQRHHLAQKRSRLSRLARHHEAELMLGEAVTMSQVLSSIHRDAMRYDIAHVNGYAELALLPQRKPRPCLSALI